MAISFFTPAATAQAQMSVSSTSSSLAIPGSANPALYIFNSGPNAVSVLLSASGATVATAANGTVIAPGQSIFLGIGANTFISAITVGGGPSNSSLQLSAGT